MNASRVVSGVVLAAFLGLSPGALAQVSRGSIYGTVTDNSGAVLPGTTVQLTSAQTGAREVVTGAQGEFRFDNLDPGEYNLRATLAGFTPYVRDKVIVGVGTNVELKMEMAVAGVQEEVRVTADTPMLDTRTQGNVANFDQAMLNEVPTARDPWVLLQFVPGVQLDRINVGGSESGQQSVFSARGDDGSNTMWNIDGVTITDPAAIGASPTYYDFATFEEVQFTTSGQDPRQQTAGLGINFVTKRGTNDFKGQARVYFTNDDLQGTNIPSDLEALGFRGNGIRQIAEYGGDIGGPILRDRLWFWGAWAKNDIRQVAITGRPDDTELDNTSAKVNAQLAQANEFNFFYYRGEKTKIGRNAGVTRPPETTWNQTGPTSIFKFEDSHVFGPALMLSGKFAYIDGGFSFDPQGGMSAQLWRDFGAGSVNHGSYYQYITDRPQYQTNVDGSWYAGRNELRFGFQYRRTPVSSITRWPGNQTWSIVNLESLDIPSGIGWAEITRAADVQLRLNTTSFYVGDILTFGYWTINAGARFDRQNGENLPSTGPANDLAPGIVPALNYPGAPPVFTWNDVSPRIGATYRLNDSTIVKASYGRFAEQLRSTYVAFDNPVQLAAIEYYFQDANGDNIPQAGELLTATGSSSRHRSRQPVGAVQSQPGGPRPQGADHAVGGRRDRARARSQPDRRRERRVGLHQPDDLGAVPGPHQGRLRPDGGRRLRRRRHLRHARLRAEGGLVVAPRTRDLPHQSRRVPHPVLERGLRGYQAAGGSLDAERQFHLAEQRGVLRRSQRRVAGPHAPGGHDGDALVHPAEPGVRRRDRGDVRRRRQWTPRRRVHPLEVELLRPGAVPAALGRERRRVGVRASGLSEPGVHQRQQGRPGNADAGAREPGPRHPALRRRAHG